MAFRIFLDANILLDFTLKRESYPAARQLIELAVKGRVQAYITPAVVQVICQRLIEAYGAERAKELLLAQLPKVAIPVLPVCTPEEFLGHNGAATPNNKASVPNSRAETRPKGIK
jgi:predicted nucleic acid-binding protein